MNLVVFAALFLPVVLSGLSVFLFKTGERTLKLILAFGGAFLLSLSCIELIPEIYKSPLSDKIGLYILAGFFIQLFLDFLTKGVEHGHHDPHSHQHHFNPYGIIIGICIHSFLEGMPLAENYAEPELKNTLLTGIVIHNIPISIVLVSLLMTSGIKRYWTVFLLLIFALSAPLGTITSYVIGTGIENISDYFSIILAIVVGIFLHISTTILFETDEQHHFNLYKFIAIILGACVSVILLY